jgi:hypothetical protein
VRDVHQRKRLLETKLILADCAVDVFLLLVSVPISA